MYENFYGLNSRPFQLTPDPEYYFESVTHRKALSYLGYGLAQGEGFIVITGDVGAGKTTLVAHLMSTIDTARLTAANVVTSKLDSHDVVSIAAHHFGLKTDGMDKGQILGAFEEFLHSEARSGRRCLLIVDESQNLSIGALEELRMLSNFQLGGQALLQVFLLGQPEFRDMLSESATLEQLRQRVIANHHLEPMSSEEIEPYITHRLARSGWSGRPKITSNVFQLLYNETLGIPRKINTLMSRILLMGAVERCEMIDQPLVGRVLADLGHDAHVKSDAEEDVQAAAASIPGSDSAVQDDVQGSIDTENKEKLAKASSKLKALDNDYQMPDVNSPDLQVASVGTQKPEYAPQTPISPLQASSESGASDVADNLAEVDAQIEALQSRLSAMEEQMLRQQDELHRAMMSLVRWVESDVRNKEEAIVADRAA